MPGVSKPEFSRAKSSGVLDSCNKNGLLKSHLFTRGQLSSEARRDSCLPNPAAAELARPWDLGGGDLIFCVALDFPRCTGVTATSQLGFVATKSQTGHVKNPKKTPTLPVEVDDDDLVLT